MQPGHPPGGIASALDGTIPLVTGVILLPLHPHYGVELPSFVPSFHRLAVLNGNVNVRHVAFSAGIQSTTTV